MLFWYAGTDKRTPWEVLKNAGGDWVPPFLFYEGKLFTFHNLLNPIIPLHSQINASDIQQMVVEEFIASYGPACFVRLLNECFYRHLKAQGLWIDKYRKRAYFPRTDNGPRVIEYQARVRQATRTVVKKKNRYWEHKSFWFRFECFADNWTLVMLPGYVFTTDGKYDLLEKHLVNRLSTKREGRDYNNVVHNDLVFWSWVLSGGQQSTFALNLGSNDVEEEPTSSNEIHKRDEPQILIKANLSTTVFEDVEPYPASPSGPTEKQVENKLAQLEAELSRAISQLQGVKNVYSD